jgi:hypothetical protein
MLPALTTEPRADCGEPAAGPRSERSRRSDVTTAEGQSTAIRLSLPTW